LLGNQIPAFPGIALEIVELEFRSSNEFEWEQNASDLGLPAVVEEGLHSLDEGDWDGARSRERKRPVETRGFKKSVPYLANAYRILTNTARLVAVPKQEGNPYRSLIKQVTVMSLPVFA
jgi:hypothetical protein